jgi:LysM repeat protein
MGSDKRPIPDGPFRPFFDRNSRITTKFKLISSLDTHKDLINCWRHIAKKILPSLAMVYVFTGVLFFTEAEDTNAGVISFFTNLIRGNTASVSANEETSGSAKDNSQTMTLLEAAVNINPNPTQSADLTIVDDSVLETPTGPGGTTLEVEEKISNTDKVSIYIVRGGDSLATIAQMFGVTSNTILWANDLRSAKDLKVGQELIILPISGIKYIVKKGDTLDSIAKKYKGDVEEIRDFNNMSNNVVITVGDEIIIPDGEVSGSVGGTGTVSKPSTGKTASRYFIKPTKGVKTQGLHGKYRTAVDIGTPVGTTVYASAGGKVIVSKNSGYNGGYGNYIVIQHSNGMQTIYAHLSSADVSTGTSVEQGDPIGKTGNTGRSTGPHLHFEILGTKNWNPFN